MWFKVGIRESDQSVYSCTEGEAAIEKGIRYFWVDAKDKPAAVKVALQHWQRFKEDAARRAKERVAAGLCRWCGERARDGRVTCATCGARVAATQKERRDRRKRGEAKSKEQIAEERRGHLREASRRAQIVKRANMKTSDELQGTAKFYARRGLEEARDAFWRMSGPAFAEWLEARIVELGGKKRPMAAE